MPQISFCVFDYHKELHTYFYRYSAQQYNYSITTYIYTASITILNTDLKGNVLINDKDLNTFDRTKFWIASGYNATNMPPSSEAIILIVIPYAAAGKGKFCAQIAIDVVGTLKIYKRIYKSTNGWTSWGEI